MGRIHVLYALLGASAHGVRFFHAHPSVLCSSPVPSVSDSLNNSTLSLDFFREWRMYGVYARQIYIIATSGLTVFSILWAVLSAVDQVCPLPSVSLSHDWHLGDRVNN
jgi:hypothetical protein